MDLYYSLTINEITYFAEGIRGQGNWIRIVVLGQELRGKYILFDGNVHIHPIKLWIHKKSLKSETDFLGNRWAWEPCATFPSEFSREKRDENKGVLESVKMPP